MLLAFSLTGCNKKSLNKDDNNSKFNDIPNYVCVLDGEIPKGTRFTDGQDLNKDFLFFNNEKVFRCMDYIYDFDNMKGTLEVLSLDSDDNFLSAEFPFGFVNPDYIGVVPCQDCFYTGDWALDEEDGCFKFRIDIYDFEYNIKKSVPLDFIDGTYEQFYYDFAVDKDGYIHINQKKYINGNFESDFILASPDGQVLFTKEVGAYEFGEFFVMYDGNLAMDYLEVLGDNHVKHHLLQFDKISGKETVLREYVDYIPFNFYDKDTFVCGDYYQGVFLADIDSEETKNIFSWDDNNMSKRYVDSIQAFEDGTVSLIYSDDYDNRGFMILKPGEAENVHEVEFAVSASGKIHYANAVKEFNKTHPGVKIKMTDEYNQTLLLAKLSSGNGPAIVEANFIGFEKQAKLWEVIDFSDDSDLLDDINDTVLRIGSINGNLYGVMQDFSLETMATYLDEADLEYRAFLYEAEATEGLKALVSQADGLNLATYYFDHGIDDNIYLNKEGEFKLDSEEFKRILRIFDDLNCNSDMFLSENPLMAKEVLGETVYIKRPEDLILYEKYYGDGTNFFGYPGEDGPVSFVFDPFILAVPSNAPSKDKEIAMEFLKMLLSYDYQIKVKDDDSFNLSVRNDVLKEQIYSVTSETFEKDLRNDYRPLDCEPDNALNEKNLTELIEASTAYPYYRYEDYSNIMREEFGEYFEGKIDEETLMDRIEKRVGIYVKENR